MALGAQLLAAALLTLIVTLSHAAGMLLMTRLLGLSRRKLRKVEPSAKNLFKLAAAATCLCGLHLFQVALFAVFYLMVDAVPSFDRALTLSAGTYATLAQNKDFLPERWELVGAFEGLLGFLMIGWSSGMLMISTDRLLRTDAVDVE